MTTLEQKKLQLLLDAFEKEVHLMCIDLLASMCRLQELEPAKDDGWTFDNEAKLSTPSDDE